MNDISISKSGVLKLLGNLKVDKATGPYQIRPIVLKELRHEIDKLTAILFHKSLSSGSILSDWTKVYACPIFKRVTKLTQLTIVPYH